MRTSWSIALLLVLAVMFSARADAQAPGAVSQAIQRFELDSQPATPAMSELVHGLEVEEAFERHLAPLVDQRQTLSLEERRQLFRAIYRAYFYALSEPVLAALEDVFADLDVEAYEDAIARQDDVRHYAQALLAGRRMDRLDALARAHGLKPPIDMEVPAAALTADGFPVVRFQSAISAIVEPWDLANTDLLVIIHPGCGYSKAALKALRDDQQLLDFLAPRTLFLVPQDLTWELDEMARWALAHPELSIRLAFRLSDLPQVEHWATPHFYALREGKIVGSLDGWPKGSTIERLRGFLRNSGTEPR